jgi:hypothetical protein
MNRHWRVLGTGFSFLVFGLGGLVLGGLVFPLLRLLVPDGHAAFDVEGNPRGAFLFFVS